MNKLEHAIQLWDEYARQTDDDNCVVYKVDKPKNVILCRYRDGSYKVDWIIRKFYKVQITTTKTVEHIKLLK